MRGEQFDYIVVGAGSAGCIVTHRLAAAGHRVLLLEAGRSDLHWTIRMPGAVRAHYEADSPFNWHFSTTAQRHLDHRRIYQPRGKALGGSSSINGTIFLRGNALDYERWAQEGARGWTYAQVLPYYKRLECRERGENAYRGGDGPVTIRVQEALRPLDAAFVRAGEQAGFPWTDDVNGHQQDGFCRFDSNVHQGVRANTASAYLRRSLAPDHPVPRVITGATGVRVLIELGRAVGFAYRHRGEVNTAHAEREVILSAGAFGSPQLLMLSGVGPADHLREHGVEVALDLPEVGENLHDHLEVHVQHRARSSGSLNRYLRLDRKLAVGLQWILFKRGICARAQCSVGAFLRSDDSVAHPNVQFHFFPAYFSGDWHPSHRDEGYRLGTGPMRPTSRGRARLASADPAAPLDIDPNYLSTPEDREEIHAGFELARETLRQAAFAPYDLGETEPGPEVRTREQIDAYIRRVAGSAYHPVGTCKMGDPRAADVVVDPQGQVRGIDGLRVVDASIMPSVVSSNTNAASMMLAEKLSDAILGRAPLPAVAVRSEEPAPERGVRP